MDVAIKEYRQALRIKPNNAETHYKLGFVLFRKGLLDEAIEEWREALRINPEDAIAYKNLEIAFKKKRLGERQ
jgi:tetratricopeptide (TPR) repeat protein